jgi:hypothetical protein
MTTKITTALEIYREEGAVSLLDRAKRHYASRSYRRVERLMTRLQGRYLFDHDWDLAVVLDACRYDLAAEREQSRPGGLGDPERVYSVGGHSADWIERTFEAASDSTVSETAYVSANPFTDRAPAEELCYLDRVYQYAWDPELGTVPPRPVTDRAIRLMRQGAASRYVVHYMQPHLPPLDPSGIEYGRWEPTEGIRGDVTGQSGVGWELAESGEAADAVVGDYRNNLDPVLHEVGLLLENVEASEVVVTADHGNYLGERGRWGHLPGHVHPAVRHVPWWVTEATDAGTHSPARYDRTNEVSRDHQLEALGYR